MLEISDSEKQLLVAAQRGIPVVDRPFAVLGERSGITEEDVISLLNGLIQTGAARRFGAVFDARKLGYRSALCYIDVPLDKMDEIAALITPLRGVTHLYHRGWSTELPRDSIGGPGENNWPNLWFTLATPVDSFEAELDSLRKACAPLRINELPALKRFKIDVVFDMRTRDRDEKVEPRLPSDSDAADVYELSEDEMKIVKYFEGDLPIVSDFYGSAAENLGVDKVELMEILSRWMEKGIARRIGVLLRHRRVGFKANGMCAWTVPADQVLDAGRRLAACPEVTHCYERPAKEGFPYNLFAMIHTSSWDKTQQLFKRISDDCGLKDGQLLLSVREFKKTSMQFF